MEAEQKTEIVKKAVLEEREKKEIKVNAVIKADRDEPEEEKMEVDAETVKTESEEKEDLKPLILKVESECEDIANLKIEGIEIGDDDDDDEEYVIMSPEEIRGFLEQKISEHVKDPEINPLLALEKRSQDLYDEVRNKAEELSNIGKAIDALYRNQEKFLRHMDIFPKLPTNSVSVSVDLPLLMDSVPLMTPSKAQDEDAVIRKDLSDAKVLCPSVSRTKPTTAIPKSTPHIPSAISITPVPNTGSAAPAVPKANPAAAAPVSNSTTTIKSVTKTPPKPNSGIECIDLTDDTPLKSVTNPSPMAAISLVKHPAPLPPKPFCAPNSSLPNIPPKPRLKIFSEERGIVLQWDMPPCYSTFTAYPKLKSFDIFGYQEQKNMAINTLLWKKIGTVKAMNLPMACTLTQFLEGQKYHFAIRAVDIYDRCGSYSDPISIVYKPHSVKKA